MRILHIVDTLARNGRTILLQELVRHAGPGVQHLVVTLKSPGGLARRFNEAGVEVHPLNLYAPLRGLRQKGAVPGRVSHFRPDICFCWSGDANLISIVPRLFAVPVIWTIHNSIGRSSRLTTRYALRSSALLSRLVPEKIICCSNKTYEIYRDVHRYSAAKLMVVANGVDVVRFRPNGLERERIRRELGIPESAIVVSTAAWMKSSRRGSLAEEKDLETLLKVAAIVCRQKPDTLFLLFGANLNYQNEQLTEWLSDYELQRNVRLLGYQEDVSGLFAASDIYAMSSTSEGLPLSLLEAMSSGVIPVCTDAGDIREAIGSAGFVVPQKSTDEMAASILYIAGLGADERAEYSRRAVETINTAYNIDLLVQQYIAVATQVISGLKQKRS